VIGDAGALAAAEIRRRWREACEQHLRGDVSRETPSAFPSLSLREEMLETELPMACFEKMELYARRVLEANAEINLVSRRDPVEQILVNLLDSLPLAYLWPVIAPEARFLLDAGSGSGVPGIPVWLALTSMPGPGRERPPELVLLEARKGKAAFLSSVLESLSAGSAGDAHSYPGRLEEPPFSTWLDEQIPEGSGLLCARALASVDRALHWSRRTRHRLDAAAFVKGATGLGKEWHEERSRWPKRGWEAGDVFHFHRPEHDCFYLCLRPSD